MNIHSLMTRFTELGFASVGRGPKHPQSPRPELHEEIDNFLSQHPYLRKDNGYIDFLECYAGAMVDWPNGELVIDIFGFSEDVSLHLTQDEGSVIDDEGFYAFCSSVVRVDKDQESKHEYLGLGYAFDSTGTRKWGVYRCIEDEPCQWYCASFREWLKELIDKKGRLM